MCTLLAHVLSDLAHVMLFVDLCQGTDIFEGVNRKSRMEADEDDVVCIGEQPGTTSGIDTETTDSEQCAVEDVGPELGIEEQPGTTSGIDTETTESEQCAVEDAGPELGTEEEEDADADDCEYEIVQDEEDEGVEAVYDNEDDSMVVVDELDNSGNDDQKSTSDEGQVYFLFPYRMSAQRHYQV